MEVSWQDVHKTEQPGDYPFRGGMLTVRAREIEIWKEHPDATFTVVPFQGQSGPKRFVLGTWATDD